LKNQSDKKHIYRYLQKQIRRERKRKKKKKKKKKRIVIELRVQETSARKKKHENHFTVESQKSHKNTESK
jgi:hypothetical protein